MKPSAHAAVSLVLVTVLSLVVGANRLLAESQTPVLQLARGEDGKTTLAFTPVANAKTYTVRVVNDDGTQQLIENVEVVNYTVHGLKNDHVYRFAVCATSDGQKGPWSNELSAMPVDQPDWDTLCEAFTSSNPTRNSNPFTMIHGNESEAELRKMMRVAYDGGFEGVTLHPYNYQDYLGPGQWSRWKIIFDQARRLGLIVWQQDDLNYPSGFAAGRVVAAHPELGRTNLVEAAKIDLTGPKNGFSLDIQSLLKDREFLVAVSAFSENGEPVDLTDRVVQGKLTWDVPAGKWRLFVTKSVPSEPLWTAGPGPMPMVDFMNPKAVDAFIQTIYQATYDQLGSEFGRTFKGFFSDEAPVMFTQYTPDFLERFEKAKGYSLRPYLPCLLNDLSKIDRKVRVDYRDFIREQNTTVFYGRSRKWCNEHGIQLIGHVIEDHQQDMRRLECLDFPGMDEVSDQWYQPSQDVYWRIARMVSSVAHYGGSRNDIALIEHFAATGWQTGLTEMKRMMDWSTVMGLNQIVPCGLATQDPPDWEVTPEFWLHGKNPQWPYFPAYQAAANRMTMLMRGGRHVAPAIMLDDTESRWPSQPLTSKIDHSNDDLWKSCRAVNLAHVDFDLIPYYVFSDAARTCFDKATIRIGKEDYKAVILTGVDAIPAAVAERLREFYDAGGIVVALNHVPTSSVNGQEDDRVRAAVDAIWGKTASGRGKSAVVKDDDVGACLTGLNVPDVLIDPSLKSLLYYHRRLHGKDLYFFVNTAQEPIDTTVELRGVGPVASRWDPVNGAITELKCGDSQAGVTKVPLTLGEYESAFVVVEQSKNTAAAVPSPKLVRHIEVKEPWAVKNEADENHRLFSTVAKLPADWPAHSPASLELHGASEILSVTLNGKPVGMRFCAPYRFDISELLVPGDNRLEVLRVGRIVLPMGNEWMYKILKTPHDADDKTPCGRATISY